MSLGEGKCFKRRGRNTLICLNGLKRKLGALGFTKGDKQNAPVHLFFLNIIKSLGNKYHRQHNQNCKKTLCKSLCGDKH